MARLPSSFRERNRTTEQFGKMFAQLPPPVQLLVRGACLQFNENPSLPSFRRHELYDTKKGSHSPNSVSISISAQYRAISVVVDDINVWYWRVTHAEYNRFTGHSG